MTTNAAPAPDATLVVFGITGDLSHRLLMPALINMSAAGLIGDGLQIIGVGRSENDDESIRRGFEEFAAKAKGEGAGGAKGSEGQQQRDRAWASLRERIHFVRGDLSEPGLYQALRERFKKDGVKNAIFYLATEPALFGDTVQHLAAAGLLDEELGFRRLAIEKPFGHDLASAKELNERILAVVKESQVYRLDHFLGKETVRNILVTRFANTMIEAVWNSHYIDHVQITAAEVVDVGKRGRFYDATGALRDMVPNHLFQLLAMVCMEPPNSFDAEAIRNEKAKVFEAIRGPEPEDVARDTVRGVYRAGHIGDKGVPAYADTKDVAAGSRTETYAALKLRVDSWRWAGVPFYLRTGKALSHRDTHIVVVFKPVPFAQFRDTDVSRLPPNQLVMQIQPGEGVRMDFVAKRPGPTVETAPVQMKFRYADLFDIAHTTGYETLIYDMLTGDQTLFQRADGVEACWRALQPVVDAWTLSGQPSPYEAGSAGPDAADALLERDGRHWLKLGPAS